MYTVKPQDLSVAFLFSLLLTYKRSGIVAADLGFAGTAFYAAYVLSLYADFYRINAGSIVGANRRQNYYEFIGF